VATIIEMPKLSDTMSEGKILSWLKHEGDEVQAGEVLAEIESDKANMELPAYEAGFLRKVLVAEGASAPVGAAIAIVTEDASEDISGVLSRAQAGAGQKKAPEAKAEKTKPEKTKADKNGGGPEDAKRPAAAGERAPAAGAEDAPAAGRRPAAPPAQAPQPAMATASAGRTRAGAGTGGHEKVLASPLAFRMASELGLDLRSIRGTGPEGRIVKRDVEQALAASSGGVAADKNGGPRAPTARAPHARPLEPGAEPGSQEGHEDIELSSMRRIIADRLVESITTAPHYYVTMDVDMGPATRAREELNKIEGVDISLNDLIVKAVAAALVRHPGLNASWRGTTIRRFQSVDIGIAVALEEGLITPVVRACHMKSLGRISLETKDLVARAREKKLRPEEFKGGTFTVSNLGMFGVKHFTAIINPPEACILAVGGIEEVPVIQGGSVVPGRRMSMTLSSDHRVVDGAEAAKFLREVKSLLERPMSLAL